MMWLLTGVGFLHLTSWQEWWGDGADRHVPGLGGQACEYLSSRESSSGCDHLGTVEKEGRNQPGPRLPARCASRPAPAALCRGEGAHLCPPGFLLHHFHPMVQSVNIS